MIAQAQGSLQERWEAKVLRTDACWLWQGYCDPHGYGRMTYQNRVCLAHRVSWELVNGPVPSDKRVLHHCDTPACVRPDHLFLGTQLDNITDSIMKGRQKGRHKEQCP